MKLNNEEKELLDSVEKGEWKTISSFKKEAKRYREIAIANILKRRKKYKSTQEEIKAMINEGRKH